MAEIGRRLEEDLALMESLANELVLFVIEFKKSFLKVSNAPMNELCGLG